MTTPERESEPRRFALERQLRASALPPTTRLVWHVVAGYSRATTGDVDPRYSPSYQTIAEAAGLEDRGTAIRHVGTLVKTGWLLKAPGKRKGDPPRYRLSSPLDPSPPLDPLVAGEPLPSMPTGGSPATTVVAPQPPPSGPTATSASGSPATQSRVSPGEVQDPPSPPGVSTVEQLLTAAGASDDEEIRAAIRKIKAGRNIRDLGAYVATMARNGDLTGAFVDELLVDHRAARAATTALAERRQAATCPRCLDRGLVVERPGCLEACPDCRTEAA